MEEEGSQEPCSATPPSIEELRRVVFGHDSPDLRKRFEESLGQLSELFVQQAHRCCLYGFVVHHLAGTDGRRQYVASYLWNALNNLVVSSSLLLSGHLIPSGNLMRHFIESIAMAHVVSDPETIRDLNTLDQYKAQRAVSVLLGEKPCRRIGINRDAWKKVHKIWEHYCSYSHACLFSLSAAKTLSTETRALHIGGEFDPGRRDFYAGELSMRVVGAERLLSSMLLFVKQWSPWNLDQPSGNREA